MSVAKVGILFVAAGCGSGSGPHVSDCDVDNLCSAQSDAQSFAVFAFCAQI